MSYSLTIDVVLASTTKNVSSLPILTFNENHWLKNKKWDLTFLSLSIILVPIPYLSWMLLGSLGVTSESGRQAVNLAIAAFIGGPHMVATFSRTSFDKEFRQKYPKFFLSTFIIPIIVVTLALSSLPALLTIFFFIASIHVLHQITFIVESYNRKERDEDYQIKAVNGTYKYSWKDSLTNPFLLIDYGFVLTALYPLAAYRVAITKDFDIGFAKLNDVIPAFFQEAWVFYLASAVFGVFLVLFIWKSIIEIKSKTINLPKTIFIVSTAIAAFTVPILGNLDTAFQGMNVWHSFQYLALTWYANKLRKEHGELDHMPFFKKMSGDKKVGLYYGFNLLLTAGVGVIIAIAYVVLRYGIHYAADPAHTLETSYYIGVLSVLWQHYYHDHFLFTRTNALMP